MSITVLPDELADLLDDALPAEDAATDAEVAAFLAEHRGTIRPPLMLGPVRQLEAAIAEGRSRHDSTPSAAVWAMDEARAGYYPAEDADAALKEIFVNAMALRRKPSDRVLTREEAESEWKGILAWAVGQAKAKTDAELDAIRARINAKTSDNVEEVPAADITTGKPGEPDPDADKAGDNSPWTFADGATFILDIPATIPAIWGEGTDVLWAEGESLMIAGPLGLGKTTLAGLLIRAQLRLSLDGMVLGLPVAECGGKILYLAMDRPSQAARAMGRQFTDEHRDVLAKRLVVWKGPPPADIAKKPALLAELADAAGASTVYLDSIKDAAIGLSEDEVGAGYNRARQHLLAQGVQLNELHHTTKRGANGGAPTSVADIYGSAWITNGTGSIIMLSGDPGDPIVGFRHVRQPANEVGPYRLLHDQAAGEMSVEHSVDLVELVDAAGADGLTAKGAATAMFDKQTPTRADIQKARRKLDDLTTAGFLTRLEGTKGGEHGGRPTAWFAA
jgi:AAA domain-containing protein